MSAESQLRIILYNSFKEEQFELPKGSRPWYILMLLAEGRFTCRMNGQRFTAEAGDAICFPPNIPFERRVEETIRFHQVGFFLPRGDPCAAILPAGRLNIPKERLAEMIAALDRAICYPPEEAKQLYTHVVSHLLLENYIHCSKEHPPAMLPDREIAAVVQYFSDHIGEKINMEELAEQMHLSYTGFLWKFRRAMQCTPSEYLIRVRMQYAKRLLLDGDLRINEIARLCGYSNAYYFSTAFHHATGMAPSVYREQKMQMKI